MNTIFIGPEQLTWDSKNATMIGKTESEKLIIVPKEEMGNPKESEIQAILKRGLFVQEIKRTDNFVIASRKRILERDFEALKIGTTGIFRVTNVTRWGLFTVPINGEKTCLVYVTEVSTSRMELMKVFRPGDLIEARVISKDEETGRINLSRKAVYAYDQNPSSFTPGEIITVRLTTPANEDGFFVEVTPGLSGIVSGTIPEINKLRPYDIIQARVKSYRPGKGLKLDLIE